MLAKVKVCFLLSSPKPKGRRYACLKSVKKKLKALGVNRVVDPLTGNSIMCKNLETDAFSVDRDDRKLAKLQTTPVVNLSSVDLTESENRLLSKGLDFCPRPKSYDRGNLLHDTKASADACVSNRTSVIVMTLTAHRRNIRVSYLKAIGNPPDKVLIWKRLLAVWSLT